MFLIGPCPRDYTLFSAALPVRRSASHCSCFTPPQPRQLQSLVGARVSCNGALEGANRAKSRHGEAPNHCAFPEPPHAQFKPRIPRRLRRSPARPIKLRPLNASRRPFCSPIRFTSKRRNLGASPAIHRLPATGYPHYPLYILMSPETSARHPPSKSKRAHGDRSVVTFAESSVQPQ
jgi:hypothetical protein